MKKAGVVAFAFGVPASLRSNRRIAEIASRKAKELNGRIYTQMDVFITGGIPTEYITDGNGNPPPTLRIARGAAQWARRNNIDQLWIAAAKPHLWRVMRDMRRAAAEEGISAEIFICAETYYCPEEFWFCQDSLQERTRSWWSWNKRELILRLAPFFIYKRIAG